jgi:hypothetical protein
VWEAELEGIERVYTADPFGNRIEFLRDGHGFSQRPEASPPEGSPHYLPPAPTP